MVCRMIVYPTALASHFPQQRHGVEPCTGGVSMSLSQAAAYFWPASTLKAHPRQDPHMH